MAASKWVASVDQPVGLGGESIEAEVDLLQPALDEALEPVTVDARAVGGHADLRAGLAEDLHDIL